MALALGSGFVCSLGCATALATLAIAAAPDTSGEQSSPPDPRMGEALDGRPPVTALHPPSVPALLLSPARAASWLLLTPLDRGVAFLEERKVPARVYETLTSDDRLVGLRPSLRYQSGFALAGGFRAFDRRTLGPGSLVALDGTGGPRFLGGSLTLRPPGASGFYLQVQQWWQGDALFAGVASLRLADLRGEGFDLARYQVIAGTGVVGWQRRIAGIFLLRSGLGLQRRDYGNGVPRKGQRKILDVFCPPIANGRCELDSSLVPGFEQGLRLLHAHAGGTVDTRPNSRFGSGLWLHTDARYAHGLAGDPSQHTSLRLGLGGTWAWGDHSLSGYSRAGVLWRLAQARIPFEELFSPTGDQGLRGLRPSRIRGQTEALVTVQYRWLLSPRVDALLFVDKGNAYGDLFNGISWANTFTSYGGALRVQEFGQKQYWAANTSYGALIAYTPSEGFRLSLAAESTF